MRQELLNKVEALDREARLSQQVAALARGLLRSAGGRGVVTLGIDGGGTAPIGGHGWAGKWVRCLGEEGRLW